MFLTIDAGSSSVRALLWDEAGRARDDVRVQIPYQMDTTPDGGVEMSAQRLLDLVVECLDTVMAQLGHRAGTIRAVGVTTFWHSLLGVDARGDALTPIYSWADNRAGDVAQRLRGHLDASTVHRRTGCALHASYYPAKLIWLRETFPAQFQQVARWVSPAEYLYGQLFGPGAMQVSVSMASGTGLLDQETCQWDCQMLEALGLTPEQFSPIIDLSHTVYGLAPDHARRWPALQQTPFLPAVGDGACSNVGSGCLTPDRTAINLGTSGAMRVVWQEDTGPQRKNPQPPPGLWRYRVDSRRPIMGAAFSDGGHVLAFMRKMLHLTQDVAALQVELEARRPGAHGLTFLPFLAGERSPGWTPKSRAVIAGMSLHTEPVEVLCAALEGVTLQFCEGAERLRAVFGEPEEYVASGGAFEKLPYWAQMLADALGCPVTLLAESEATSRGAALLAMEAIGHIRSAQELPPAPGRTYDPDPERHRLYREMLQRQRELYRRLSG
ncbi:MAG: gluconokinase [Chloroherpetonaceae bacterium]|nr:gluconokinase [Chthonomonadaceae bacterium]MDW8207248.1 gluconokinase [Chloroherpetonaceae bacterium]